ncbi:TVP38/TMEM64 family protein [Dyadobacter subterraneus]|uniref:TVP38/TMEM64 family membrane protein n=1 Tax=Dyadobacter subterraneus TaxID=2773304 RepID=A0ABR9WIY5_9BACT|nr:VTT domain-containing protein [Dyadobacter subterraneus]MBE9465479.1 TVP38/TMEM64 family protein [Dyadobacter subterraneus]
MTDLKKNEKAKRNNYLTWIAVAVLVGLVASYFLFPELKAGVNEAFDVLTSKDEVRIKSWVKQFGALGPIVVILAMTLQMFLLIIPNLLLFIIAIICYGPIWGSLICLAGVFASSSLGFIIGRKLGPGAIDKFVSEKTQTKISLYVKEYGVKAIAIARLSSLASDALGFVAGILEMKYKKFIAATMAGIIPVIVLIAIFGKSGKIEKSLIFIGAISLIILGVNIFLDKRKQRAAMRPK